MTAVICQHFRVDSNYALKLFKGLGPRLNTTNQSTLLWAFEPILQPSLALQIFTSQKSCDLQTARKE